ncbi:MAG: glycoside hydrolase family 127 protein [Lentisphaeria bacterium]|nr:glycoside hydrolase family 127 protein [Lentisphaeria bacterium]
MKPFDLKNVKITDQFWGPRLRTNREVTLPVEYDLCKKTGRYDAWKWKKGDENPPHVFWDSDVAKWLEAGAYSLATNPDPVLEERIDTYVAMLENGQMDDGYLNSHFSLVEPGKRWSNLRDQHELYCAGHLMEAAVAYVNATGKRKFLDIMCRYADYIDRVFGPQKGQKRGYPGHQEIELALVKLYHATGRKEYVNLAEFFLLERGQTNPHYYNEEEKARGDKVRNVDTYSCQQAHMPVTEQTEAVGHAVRAAYMYAGMADVAAETGNEELLKACRGIWDNIVGKRMYVTGGIGSNRFGESFTCDYDLPNQDAYAETCAAIALVFFAHRMFHLEKDGQYTDIMERALYNGVMSGVSLDGKHFFYANRLAVKPETIKSGGHNYPPFRQEWFGCSCCPTNIVRLLASFGTYVYSVDDTGIWVNLYTDSHGTCEINGENVTVRQETAYPWNETVGISITVDAPVEFCLNLRIPQWCRNPAIKVNGEEKALADSVTKGYARIQRRWQDGDKVELVLPMPVEIVEAHPNVRQDSGKVALQRGPLVYCLEETDNGKNLERIFLQESADFAICHDPDLLGGVTTIETDAFTLDTTDWGESLYRSVSPSFKKKRIIAIPYYVWANRELGEMVVWINRLFEHSCSGLALSK